MNYRDVDIDANMLIRQLSGKIGDLETQVMLKEAQIEVLAGLMEEAEKRIEYLTTKEETDGAVQE